MSMYERIKKIFDAPSRRRNADYSNEVNKRGVFAVLLLYRDYLEQGHQARYGWMPNVLGQMAHLHHELASVDRDRGFEAISKFLLREQIPTSTFLDFLEVSFRNDQGPLGDNDFVDAVNRVLEEYESPYLLTRYVVRVTAETDKYYGEIRRLHYDAFPQAYLKGDTITQSEAIEPALGILSGPGYEAPLGDFQKALSRQRLGDYDGCVTSCAAAVEGTIKVAAAILQWNKVKGDGLGKLAKSFIVKSSLPDTLETLFRPLAVYRSTKADAHGHIDVRETPPELASYFIVQAAALIVLVRSQVD